MIMPSKAKQMFSKENKKLKVIKLNDQSIGASKAALELAIRKEKNFVGCQSKGLSHMWVGDLPRLPPGSVPARGCCHVEGLLRAQKEPESHLMNQDPSSLPTDQATTQPEVPLCATSPWTDRPDECHEHASATHFSAKVAANCKE